MIEAARRARRPDRQSRDTRFAQAMRALPACNLGRSELVRSGRERRYCRRDRIQAALFDVRALGALERSATGALE